MTEQRIANWSSLGAVIRAARKKKDLTQQALAARAGVSRAWLAKVEAGHRAAEFEQILKTLAALDLSLVVRTEEPDPRDSALRAALAARRAGRGKRGHRD